MSSNKSFSAETSDRYARAVFELALENSELETVEKNIHDLLNLYNKNINLVQIHNGRPWSCVKPSNTCCVSYTTVPRYV